MLTTLAITDLLLVQRLTLVLDKGLTVLTGETGAGKSILLDALGLALGAKAESSWIREGAEQAVVVASFELPPTHPVFALLQEQGMNVTDEEQQGLLILRRLLTKDGRSRAFINDQPCNLSSLKIIGKQLVDIHNQFETYGLLDASMHGVLLDRFGQLLPLRTAVQKAFGQWQEAKLQRQHMEERQQNQAKEQQELLEKLELLELLQPLPQEEERLEEKRKILSVQGKLLESLQQAWQEISRSTSSSLGVVLKQVNRAAVLAEGRLDTALAALERASVELQDAQAEIKIAADGIGGEEQTLEEIEERLHYLRQSARRLQCLVEDLPQLHQDLQEKMAEINAPFDRLLEMKAKEKDAQLAYEEVAQQLSAARIVAGKKLEEYIAKELAGLKMPLARFLVELEKLPELSWQENGVDQVRFLMAANPGMQPGLLHKVASGGELSRLMLAVKVALAGVNDISVMVFDEVDAGVGGAVADAVGARLARLAAMQQVVVVTHSPQIAARGNRHFLVEKKQDAHSTQTHIRELPQSERLEEIARMLSGEVVSNEARAAAASLLHSAA
ncbi:MAG: DNA repair protein RecN [Alphaproteobacteria bacterium]